MHPLKLTLLTLALAVAVVGSAQEMTENLITVSGQGVAYGEPTLASFEVGVNIVNEDVRTATQEANETMERVLAALQGAGVAERDLRTVGFNIQRDERYNQRGEVGSVVYRVVNRVRVTVRDIAEVGELLARGLEAGANTASSISFTLANPDALEQQARERAMNQARRRAEHLANLAGVELAEVNTIRELGGGFPVAMQRMSFEADMAEAASVPIAAGELEVGVTLEVSFHIRPTPSEATR